MAKIKQIGNEIIVPLKTVKQYRMSENVFELASLDHLHAMANIELKHPHLTDLIFRLGHFITPLFCTHTGKTAFDLLFEAFYNYISTKDTSENKAYRKLLLGITKSISTVYDYDVYALTSASKIDINDKHWNCVEKPLRAWLVDNQVNKLSIMFNKVQTNLRDLQLGLLLSRMLFSANDINLLIRTNTENEPKVLEERTIKAKKTAKYSEDNRLWLESAAMHHCAINEVADSLLQHVGSDLMDGQTSLADSILSSGLTAFYSARELHGAAYAYSLFVRDIMKSLLRLFDYQVLTECQTYTWHPYYESYHSFTKRHAGYITIRKLASSDCVISDAVFTVAPWVFKRHDLAGLTLPIPGCNAVRRGRSVLSEAVE